MDPSLDPPPLPDQPTAATTLAASADGTSTVTNLAPVHDSAHNHPPYAEMITAAISALNERTGSSKRAIAKYIESQYSDLPSSHDALLTHHLQRLNINGQLSMVKHSYTLHRSAPAPVNGAVNAVPSDPASSGLKRRPGRPPKPRPDSVQVAVPVFAPPVHINAAPLQPNVSIGLDNSPAAGSGQPVRRRGRPPKIGGLKMDPGHSPASGEVKRGRGRPPKSGSGGGPVKRGRGRPKAAAAPATVPVHAAQVKKVSGRPRGRPPKSINVVEGVVPPRIAEAAGAVGGGVTGVAPVVGKRRGRPPRAFGEVKKPRNVIDGQLKKHRQLSGKPLGRPKKNASAAPANRSPDSQLLVAYLDLKAKLENLQSRTSQTANLIKPYLTNEAAINALQELELIATNVITPPSAAAVAQNQPEQYPQQPEI